MHCVEKYPRPYPEVVRCVGWCSKGPFALNVWPLTGIMWEWTRWNSGVITCQAEFLNLGENTAGKTFWYSFTEKSDSLWLFLAACCILLFFSLWGHTALFEKLKILKIFFSVLYVSLILFVFSVDIWEKNSESTQRMNVDTKFAHPEFSPWGVCVDMKEESELF